MASFDESLKRMQFLMDYDNTICENKTNRGIEYHTIGADGNAYGIIKEGTKYFIKKAPADKETIAEAYDYINGFRYRNENSYSSYNEASKQLELKMMSINEAYDKHSDVSTVDFKANEKGLAHLTEEARKELNRIHTIMENSTKIGMTNTGDPEGKYKASEPASEGAPFTDGAKFSEEGTKETLSDPKKANDYEDASKGVEAQMTSTKAPKGGKSDKDMKDTEDDLEGKSVAAQHPNGGKVVRVNEGYDFDDDDYADELDDSTSKMFDDLLKNRMKGAGKFAPSERDVNDFKNAKMDADSSSEEAEAPEAEIGTDSAEGVAGLDDDGELIVDFDDDAAEEEEPIAEPEPEVAPEKEVAPAAEEDGTDIEGLRNKYKDMDFDELFECLEEELNFDGDEAEEEAVNEEVIPEDPALVGPKGNGQSISVECLGDCPCKDVKDGGEEALKGPKGTLGVQTVERLSEAAMNRIVKSVCEKLVKESKKANMSEMIDRIVSEEVLHVFGDHPRYGKEPMELPANTEVKKGTADKDWNDDSAKGSERYGKKIGSSAPFTQTVDRIITDAIKSLKEDVKKK